MNAAVASPAGFWKRYVAYCIDALLVWSVLEALWWLLFRNADSAELEHLRALLAQLQDGTGAPVDPTALLLQATGLLTRLTLATTLAYAVLGGAYFILMESSRWQGTLGKRLVGIKVVDAAGHRITPARALGRFAAAALSWLTMNIGHALAAWTPERRALHDYLVGTCVVNADPSRPGMPWWGWLIVAANALAFVAVIVFTMVAAWQAVQAAAG
ncbi:MAG: RDD family protein [Proteobacteria bacterium]|nr:RDD family protein [Pseudomonadota bacterium]